MSRALLLGAGGSFAAPAPIPPVAGPALWFAADHITGLSDGAALTTWPDSSGNGRDVTQATGSKKPLYKTAILNGKPVVRFDGSDDILVRAGASILSGQSGSLFVVGKFNATSFDNFFAAGDESSTNQYLGFGVGEFSSNMRIWLTQRNADPIDEIRGTSTALVAGTFYRFDWHSSGSAWTLHVSAGGDQAAVQQGSNSGEWFGDVSTLDNISIGAKKLSVETEHLNGDIAEILYYEPVLSSGNKTTVRSYLATKYGSI